MIPYSLPYARWKRSNPALKYRVCERQNFINEDGTAESQEADKGAYGVVDHGGTGRQKESDVAIEQDAFPELSDRELEKLLVAGVESSFSGALPPPDIFMQYPIEVRERMCAWNDAFTINESHLDFLPVLKHRDSQHGTYGSACRVRTSLAIARPGRGQIASCIVSMRV